MRRSEVTANPNQTTGRAVSPRSVRRRRVGAALLAAALGSATWPALAAANGAPGSPDGDTAAGAPAAIVAGAAWPATGPSTSHPPYLVAEAPGVELSSILSVAGAKTAGNGYRMVGAPDGLGSFTGINGNARVLMNHELRHTEGIARAHGRRGAFVSIHEVVPATGEVVTSRDLITSVSYWDYATGSYGSVPGVVPGTSNEFGFNLRRFCSGTLAGPDELFNPATGRGYEGRLWLTGEENGQNGRLFGIDVATGEARQLPRVGLRSWENAVPVPTGSDTTLLIRSDDITPGYLGAYVGTKTATGGPWSRAGLGNGESYVLRAAKGPAGPIASDFAFRAAVPRNVPARIEWVKVDWNQRGTAQSEAAAAEGALAFVRIEDLAVDPSQPRDVYFTTTERPLQADQSTNHDDFGGLWRLRLDNPAEPLAGGTLTLLIDGSTGRIHNPDNLAFDRQGHLLIAEDPGNDPRLAGLWAYRPSDGALRRIAGTDPGRFSAAGATNEEISGIVDASSTLGEGTFLLDVMAHNQIGLPADAGAGGSIEEVVENGQLLRLRVDWREIFGPDTHQLFAVPPTRIYDSRQIGPPLAAGSVTSVQVAGKAGVPSAGAAAVVLTITATDTAEPGYFTAFPAGSATPATSSLNVDRAGDTVPNQVTVALGEAGAVSVFSERGGHLIIDVAGYYAPTTESHAGRFQPVDPQRLLDTRAGAAPLAGSVTKVPIAGRGGVPAVGASAVVVNVTATVAAAAGYFTVYPAGTAPPNASHLNANRADDTVAALVTVPLGTDGAISVFSERGAHLIVDVVGWYTDRSAPSARAGLFVPRELTRVFDSRVRSRLVGGAIGTIDPGPPAGAVAMVANLTATSPAGTGYMTAWAAGTVQPPTSNLNMPAKNSTLANAAIVAVGPTGMHLFTDVATHAIVDVSGWIVG